jgi:CHASE3 domain sensor protein/GAF domain-containing protein
MNKLFLANIKMGFFRLAMSLVILLIVVNTLAIFLLRLNQQLNQENVALYQEAKALKQNIIVNLNGADMSVRGFLLVGNPAFEDTFQKVRGQQTNEFRRLDSLLLQIGYMPKGLGQLKQDVMAYYDLQASVIGLGKSGRKDEALAIVKEDKGTEVWMGFMEFGEPFDLYMDELLGQIDQANNRLIFTNSLLQSLLAIIGLPLLVVVIATSVRNQKNRQALLSLLLQKDREMIFDPGDTGKQKAELGQVVNGIVAHLGQSRDFVQKITDGDYDASWEGLTPQNHGLNKDSLSGKLHEMRDKMTQVKRDNDARAWLNQGLADLTAAIRQHQGQDSLYREVLLFVVKRIRASAGSLFVLQDQAAGGHYLAQKATYAYNREKLLEGRVDIGEGLVGQVFLEAETLVLEALPENYIKIQSGLGDTLPTTLAVVPLKYNDAVTGVLEIASLEAFGPQQLQFLDKAAESIASSLQNQQNSERTTKLLKETQQLAEQLRSQEEEIRQNLEEMQATTEEAERKYRELQAMYQRQSAENEEAAALLGAIPVPWLVVDASGKIARANDEAGRYFGGGDLVGMDLEQVLGHSLPSLAEDPGNAAPLPIKLARLSLGTRPSYLLAIF